MQTVNAATLYHRPGLSVSGALAAVEKVEIGIEFPDQSDADRDRIAQNLGRELRAAGAEVQLRQPDKQSMFSASELMVLFDTKALAAVAIGIQVWLARRNRTSLIIRRGNTHVTLSNATGNDAITVLEKVLLDDKKKKEKN